MSAPSRRLAGHVVDGLLVGYATFIAVGLAVQYIAHVRWWPLAFVADLTPYWFIALPVLVPIVVLVRRPVSIAAAVLTVGLFMVLYGPRFVPRPQVLDGSGQTLRVMSYNCWVGNDDPGRVVDAVRAADADLVAFQELGSVVATAVDEELENEFPYRILEGEHGVLSRYSITRTPATLPGSWGDSSPAVEYMLDFGGKTVIVLVTHHYSSVPIGDRANLQRNADERFHQAEHVAEYAYDVSHVRDVPLVVATDLNATDRSAEYHAIGKVLNDVWAAAGFGMGYTWRLPLPIGGVQAWAARIDYVLHSDHWRAVDATLGNWDGQSDHRPVIATLELRQSAQRE